MAETRAVTQTVEVEAVAKGAAEVVGAGADVGVEEAVAVTKTAADQIVTTIDPDGA